MKTYLKEKEIIDKLKAGGIFTQLTSFVKPGSSLSSKVTHKNYISYHVDGSPVHHLTAKSMLERKIVATDPNSYERTLGGSTKKLILK